jgi:hypothetical protein
MKFKVGEEAKLYIDISALSPPVEGRELEMIKEVNGCIVTIVKTWVDEDGDDMYEVKVDYEGESLFTSVNVGESFLRKIDTKRTICPFDCPHNKEGKCVAKKKAKCYIYQDYRRGA